MRRRHTYRRIEKNEEINVVHVALHLSLAAKNRLTFPNQQSPSKCSWEIMDSWTPQFILNKICHCSPFLPWINGKKLEKITLGVFGLATPTPQKNASKNSSWTLKHFRGSSRLDGGGLPTARSVAARICLFFAPWRWKTVKAPCREQVPHLVGWGRLEISKSTSTSFFWR